MISSSLNYKEENLCPVCGCDLGFEPWKHDRPSHEICPSCGTHFGYHDDPMAGGIQGTRQQIYEKLRKKWIKGGMKWWCKDIDCTGPRNIQPSNWEPAEQLKRIGVELKDYEGL